MQIKKDYVEYAVIGVLLLFVLSFTTGFLGSTVGYNMVVIQNSDPNSMNPTYVQGDIFIIQKVAPEEIRLGDVVVYENSRGELIIHRVIKIMEFSGDYRYVVKGDNPVSNYQPDTDGQNQIFIPYDKILGKIVVRVPMLGHVSLAMQRNPGVQIMIYFFAAIAGLAIIFWPEDEKEEEEQYIEISRESFLKWLNSLKSKSTLWIPHPQRFSSEPLSKKVRFLTIITLGTLLLLASTYPAFFYMNQQNFETGFVALSVQEETLKVNHFDLNGVRKSTIFYQLLVQLYDRGDFGTHIKSFEVDVYDTSNKVISHTEWNVKGRITGLFTVGGSIIIDLDDMDNIDQTMFVLVTVTIDHLFSERTIQGSTNFTYNAITVPPQ